MSLSDHPLWRKPQHHLDSEKSSDHVHWLELFYDLVHVVSIFVLGNYLSHHLSVEGFAIFAMLFVVVWFAWFDLSLFNSLYVSTDIRHRLVMAAQILTVMLMTSSIHSIDHGGWAFFAVGYALNRLIIAYLYRRARKVGDSESSLPCEMSRNYGIASAIFAVSAFLPQPYGYILFGIGMVVIWALFVMPKIGIVRHERLVPRLGHMAERFALLLLIVVGEGFFKLIITLSEYGVSNVSPDVFVNYIIGGFSLLVMCWIYFDFAGNGKPRSTDPKTMMQWTLSHLLLMLSAVCVGVALSAEVKVGFWDHYPFKYAVIGCLGLAGYLYALLLIQNVIEERTAHQFATAKIRMVGIGLSFVALAIVAFVPALIGNFVWGAALISQAVIPMRNAYVAISAADTQAKTEVEDAG
ncbi:low temperature requirement protein A [Grimontia sp. SpTr1]|uniref:low temperature requirement protein A n=1 Tax=Grimontia sp. SpTr1 TaxID=2995319 RepID=UPI00248D1A35|nr:low temperature requirement protein A [Grimontia sp. SpTr1]